MVARLKRGIPAEDLEVDSLPAEYLKALSSWQKIMSDKNTTEEQKRNESINLSSVLSEYLQGNFAVDNLPSVRKILKISDDIPAESIVVTGFAFDDSNIPVVNIEARFTFSFKKEMTQEELSEWESNQDDPLSWCLNFWWSFEDAPEDWEGYLDTNDGVSLEIAN